jgi:hypothetical protein
MILQRRTRTFADRDRYGTSTKGCYQRHQKWVVRYRVNGERRDYRLPKQYGVVSDDGPCRSPMRASKRRKSGPWLATALISRYRSRMSDSDARPLSRRGTKEGGCRTRKSDGRRPSRGLALRRSPAVERQRRTAALIQRRRLAKDRHTSDSNAYRT